MQRSLQSLVFICLSILVTFACHAPSSDQGLRLESEETSSSEVNEKEGNYVDPSEIEWVKFLPGSSRPSAVYVSLFDYLDKSSDSFIKELYRIVQSINQSQKLISLESIPNPTPDQKKQRQIKIVVLVPEGRKADFDKLIEDLGDTADHRLPNIRPLYTPDNVEVEQWMQDFGEVVVAQVKGQSQPVHLAIQTKHLKGGYTNVAEILSKDLNIPYTMLGRTEIDEDDVELWAEHGGNIDVTPNGVLYMGDAVDGTPFGMPIKPSPLFDQFKSLGNPDAFKANSNWLSIGMVDEYLAFVPTKSPCGFTLIYTQPLHALKMLIEDAADADFERFADGLANTPIWSSESEPVGNVGVRLKREELRIALNLLRRNPSSSISTDVNDYDLSRVNPLWARLGAPTGVPSLEFDAFLKSGQEFANFYIWQNIRAHALIEKQLALLTSAAKCEEKEGLPLAYMPDFTESTSNPGQFAYTGLAAQTSSPTGMIVLRDHIITSDPGVDILRDKTTEVLTRLLEGGKENIHYINSDVFSYGNANSGAYVIRELDH